MKRVVILGGSGLFGGLIAERLRGSGIAPLVAARTRGDLRIDADDPASIRASLKARDLVIDTAGPFQKRTPALIDAARTIGFDVLDLSDSAEYSAMVYEREWPIGASGIRVLTACSTLSTVTAFAVASSGLDQPQWVRTYLMPASRYTANETNVAAFLASFEGTARTFRFPEPFGSRTGLRVRSVDALTIPRAFPSVRIAELFVDTGTVSGNLFVRVPFLRRLIERNRSWSVKMARRIGPTSGLLGYDIASTLRHKDVIFAGPNTHVLAILPAVVATIAIVNGRYRQRGLIPPAQHVDAGELRAAIAAEGIETITA